MIIHQQKAAAEELGVTPTALRNWEKEDGFPDFAAGYDIEKIRAWMKARDRKGSARSKRIEKFREKRLKHQADVEQQKSEALQRKALLETGVLRESAEIDAAIAEACAAARDEFMSAPKELAILVPEQFQQQLIREGERVMAKILAALAERLTKAGGRAA